MNHIEKSNHAPVVFLTGTHDEAERLLRDVRSYMAGQYRQDVAKLSPGEALRVHCESTRMTTRLTCVMSWLALQQAAQTGQMSREDIQSKHLHFPPQMDYFGYRSDQDPQLPLKLRELLSTSRDLYIRMTRLYVDFRDTHQSFEV